MSASTPSNAMEELDAIAFCVFSTRRTLAIIGVDSSVEPSTRKRTGSGFIWMDFIKSVQKTKQY